MSHILSLKNFLPDTLSLSLYTHTHAHVHAHAHTYTETPNLTLNDIWTRISYSIEIGGGMGWTATELEVWIVLKYILKSHNTI